jgi:hypothetical protein
MTALLLTAAPAWADVTLTQTTGGKMFGGGDQSGTSVTRIKGHKMRLDTKRGSNDTSMIFDVDAGKMITLNHATKEATVTNTADFGQALSKIPDANIESSLTATSEKKTVAGQSCTVYDMRVAVTFTMMEKQPPMTFVMSGPACLSKTAPGHADVAEFYSAASQKGFIFTDPAVAKAQPGMAKGMAAMMKKAAEGGVSLSSDMSMTFEGEGMMAQMMKKMGGTEITTEVTKVETGALADDVFAVPAGYKTKEK